MPTIRAEQMNALDEDLLRRFADYMADDLFQSIPAAVAGMKWSRVSRRCLAALRAGRDQWGLSDRADLYGFVILSFLCGAEFYRNAAIGAVLEESGVANGRKMIVVIRAMLEALRRRGDSNVP